MSYLIAIDDGHGANTKGKRTPPIKELHYRQIRENEFNKEVANYLNLELKRCGFRTIFTAPTNFDTSLKARVNRANKMKADLFVSIHYNAFDGTFEAANPSGHSVHIYPRSVESRRVAQYVLKELNKGTPQKSRGIKESNFYVLRKTKMPAILSENGFMDNKREALLMIDKGFQKEVAREHAIGICNYFNIRYIPEYTEQPSEWAKESWDKAVAKGIQDGLGAKNNVTEEQLMVFFDKLRLLD